MARRIPKRGFSNYTRKVFAPVNVATLNAFEAGTVVTLELLRQAGFVNGQWDGVKVLGNGEISKKIVVKADAFSTAAKEKIEAAGGSCEII
jgi:large subunit ribosomal protein L15